MSSDVLTALVIDDEPQIRRLVRNVLQADFRLRCRGLGRARHHAGAARCRSGDRQEGIDRAAGEDPALVILDLGLPDTSGVLGFPSNNRLEVGGMTATLSIKRWDHALLRPEIRFDRATLPLFDAHKDQFSAGMALSYIF